MKSYSKVVTLVAIFIVFAFYIVSAADTTIKISANQEQILLQIKEKRNLINQTQKSNELLEKRIHDTSIEIDKLLTHLPDYTNVSNEVIQKQLVPKFESIMDQLMLISKVERSKLMHMKAANRQIAAKRYNNGIKRLNKAAALIEKKHNMLVKLDSSLESFMEFLKKLELK
jgi:hypothetical protein